MANGTIITFYSYKGGVGRSFIMANVASLLAIMGFKVLCVDWDLEAPGLNHYFNKSGNKENQGGLVDLLYSFKNNEELPWKSFLSHIKLPKSKGKLSFLSAGNTFNGKYIDKLNSLDWDEMYEENNLGSYLEKVRTEWKSAYDYVLIDSRTGISDIGGICTIQMPDVLALIYTANDQNIEGILDIATRVKAAQNHFIFERSSIITVPILSRFDQREEYLIGVEWLEKCSNMMTDLYSDWINKSTSVRDFVSLTKIPYFSYWSFGEKLAVTQESGKDPETISYYLNTIAALIAHNFNDTDLLVSDRDRYIETGMPIIVERKNKNEFEYDVYISYNYNDKQSVNAITSALKTNGLKVYVGPDDVVKPGAAWNDYMENAIVKCKHMIAIIGNSLTSWQDHEIREFISITMKSNIGRRVIPISITSDKYNNTAGLPTYLQHFSYLELSRSSAMDIADKVAEITYGNANSQPTKYYSNIKNQIGLPVNGDNFFGRDKEIKQLFSFIERGNVLLTGARGVGKTSMLKKSQDIAHLYNYNCIYLNIEALNTANDFVQQFISTIKFSINNEYSHNIQSNKSILKAIDTTLNNSNSMSSYIDYFSILGDVLSTLNNDKWLIFIDDMRRTDSIKYRSSNKDELTFDIWRWLRHTRIQFTNIRWVYSCVNGFSEVFTQYKYMPELNDLQVIELKPFSLSDAVMLFNKLCNSYGMNIPNSLITYAIEKTNDTSPLAVQLLFKHIQQNINASNRSVDKSTINMIVDTVLHDDLLYYSPNATNSITN